MSRRRELKEQITRTQDPVIRMQLQELLDKKRQQRNKGIRKIEERLDSVLRRPIDKLPPSGLHVLMLVLITILLFIIFMLLECRA
jgi:cobalamin biosynthesis Mg chelatase CobN